jgi:RNA polymerase sigma-70 factor (ECF subfamily)
VIARVVRDPARVEELAVDVFWKLRSAVRAGLDELRRQARRGRYEGLLARFSRTKTPEQLHAVGEEKEQVRGVPARLSSRHAELLVLRADGLSYDEMASALCLHPASIGTLLSRAQQAFRKEYVKSYGQPRYES